MLDGYQKVIKYPPTEKNPKGSRYKTRVYGYARYADDFVVTAKSREDIEAIKPVISEWLAQRGLKLNEEKTKITRVEENFNFLGFTFKSIKGSCYTFPQKEKVIAFLREIREWLKANPSLTQESVINYLNPIIRGWGNYYRHGASSRVFQKVDHYIWMYLWKWCQKRHPNKGKGWVKKRYFQTYKGQDWQFSTSYIDHREREKTVTLHKMSDIPIERHVKVKDDSSPDNPTLREYWLSRQSKIGKTWWDKGSKYRKIAESQNWKCPICGEHLMNGEPLHLHHIIPVSKGGKDNVENLIHLHQPCHMEIHGYKPRKSPEA
jgi:RNA-directed DNA polymerase